MTRKCTRPGKLEMSDLGVGSSVWCLVGNGGMDPYSSPYITPNNSPPNPIPHSLLSTRESLGLQDLLSRAWFLALSGSGFRKIENEKDLRLTGTHDVQLKLSV